MKTKEPKNGLERLISSLEKRIETHTKNKAALAKEYGEKCAIQNRKIADCQLQLKALKK